MMPLLLLVGAFSLGIVLCFPPLVFLLRRQEQRGERLLSVGAGRTGARDDERPDGFMVRFIASVGYALSRSGLLSTSTMEQLQQTLLAAGLRGPNGVAIFVGGKLLLLLLVPLLLWLWLDSLRVSASVLRIVCVAGAIIGLLLPDFIVRSSRLRYLKRLEVELPDALDMMVICSEAGLGLEAAIDRVALEVAHAHPTIAGELRLTSQELQYTSDRRFALQNLGQRTGLDTLKRLGGTLVQSMQYGTPLSQALRTLAAEMRGEMLIRFEARAARLPVLLTLPMIIFILPTVFLIVGAPAALKALATLGR